MKQTIILVLATVLLASPGITQVNPRVEPPKDFVGDGCTMFPDGNYRKCCQRHDRDYFLGGTGKERRESDKRLYRCVRDQKGWQNEIAATVMLLGVRTLGDSWMPAPFRWGFGQKKVKT